MSGRPRLLAAAGLALAASLCAPGPLFAQQITPTDRLCDPGGESCRDILLDYISKETVGIDVAFWFMEDARYTAAIIARWNAGVPVRVIVDPQANSTYPLNADRLAELKNAGIPMRKRNVSSILHWKTMIFAGQGVVEFSGANYSANAWRPTADPPFSSYIDEAIYFTSYASVVASFEGKYDDLWTDTASYANYANINGPLLRNYGATWTKDPELNFPPGESYANRAVKEYNRETSKLYAIMYRITDERHTNALIAAHDRGVDVRLITEPEEYRNPKRAWVAYNVDRLYMAGIPIRWRAHLGLNHQKSVLLYDRGMVIFGSSNWSSASANSQQEHNYFTQRPELFQWFDQQFTRKWTNATGVIETSDFEPAPPDHPTTPTPAIGATGQPTSGLALKWYGGPWGQIYDVYLGTDPSNLSPVIQNAQLGPSLSTRDYQSITLPVTLQPATTYYWRVVTRTMANLSRTGDVWSFTTAGDVTGPPAGGTLQGGDILLYAANAGTLAGTWTKLTDTSAAGAAAMWNPDKQAAKLSAPLASPANYFDLTFTPQANVPYHLWIRARADKDSYANDSVYVQFSNSLDGGGQPIDRIGSTDAETVILEDCDGCGVHGWGWQDNAYGPSKSGRLITFDSSDPQTIRVQVREDGMRIDQVMLSPAGFLDKAPGQVKDDTTIFPESTAPAPGPPVVTVTRQPFLQQVTDTAATIVWATAQPGPAEVRFAADGGSPASVTAVSMQFETSRTGQPPYYQHVAVLGGLTAGTTYAYDVLVQGVDVNSQPDHFTTAPEAGGGTVRFLAIGDSGTGSAEQQQIASLMSGEAFDFLLHAGDVAYGASNGTGDPGYQSYQDWFFSIYAGLLRSHPVFPANGNHDSRAATNWGQAWLDDFVLPANGATTAYPDAAERNYSFDYGPVHVVVLDTEYAFSDSARLNDQLAWLDADLAAASAPWKIALFHRPPYSSGGEHGSALDVRAAYQPIFEARGVQLALSGHEHDYERTTAINGVTYVVTGGGGAPLYPSGSSSVTAYADSRWHYLRGTATACTLQLQEVGIDGATYDQAALTRCAPPPDTEAPTAQISSPAGGSTVRGAVAVTVAASDDTAVTAVDLAVDGTPIASRTTAPYTFTWDTTALADGTHVLRATAHDAAGHTGASADVTVTVANPALGAGDILLYAADGSIAGTRWMVADDATAAGGKRLWNPDQRDAKRPAASATPASYVELTFNAVAGQPYHLWIRARAEDDSWGNDSLFVQFSGTITSSGSPLYRIGTTSAVDYNLEDCSGCGLRGWGWQDNGWGVGVNGPDLYFETTGPQTLRIQQREDGIALDQILLSPASFLTAAPGPLKDDDTVYPRQAGAPAAPDTTPPSASITDPADGATVNYASSVTVDAADDVRVARVELLVDGTVAAERTASPFVFTVSSLGLASGAHALAARATDAAGNATTSATITVTMDTTPPPAADVVLYASDATITGPGWVVAADATAAGGAKLRNPDAGAAKIGAASAAPASYAELSFYAVAGQPYHLWVRGRADADSYNNDSTFLQFSDTVDGGGAAQYRIGSTSAVDYVLEECTGCGVKGWGWHDNGWGKDVRGPNLVFATSGMHTVRFQQREDGLSIDQIVLSPTTYLATAPGPTKNDTTILDRR